MICSLQLYPSDWFAKHFWRASRFNGSYSQDECTATSNATVESVDHWYGSEKNVLGFSFVLSSLHLLRLPRFITGILGSQPSWTCAKHVRISQLGFDLCHQRVPSSFSITIIRFVTSVRFVFTYLPSRPFRSSLFDQVHTEQYSFDQLQWRYHYTAVGP